MVRKTMETADVILEHLNLIKEMQVVTWDQYVAV